MQKGTDFNKIRLRLPSSSNTIVATLQRNDKCVKTDFKEKNDVSCMTCYIIHIPYFQAIYPLNVQKSLPFDPLAIPAA